MAKEETIKESAAPVITLILPLPVASHLSQLINKAQYSGTAAELGQLLAIHDQLVAAFNEAVKEK